MNTTATPPRTLPPKPVVGQTMQVAGAACRIVCVPSYGVVEVEGPDGRRLRVQGLGWKV